MLSPSGPPKPGRALCEEIRAAGGTQEAVQGILPLGQSLTIMGSF